MKINFRYFFFIAVLFGVNLNSFAQTQADSLVRLITKCPVDSVKIDLQADLLNIYIANNDSTHFFDTYNNAYNLADKKNLHEAKITLLLRLATYYVYTHHKQEALSILAKAEEQAKNLKNEVYLAKVFYQYSLYYKWQDDYSSSLTYALKALKIGEVVKDTFTITLCYEQIGNNFRKLNNFKKASEYYLKAYYLDSTMMDESNMAVALTNIGLSYADMQQYESAVNYLKKSLVIKRKIAHPRGISNTLNILGSTYTDWHKPKEALQCLQEALVIKRQIKEQHGIAVSLINIGQVYESIGDYVSAIPYLKECIEIAQPLGARDLLMETYKSLSNCYAKSNNGAMAYQAHVSYSELKDSLYSDESQRQINDMQVKYGAEKKEQENKLLQAQNQLSEKAIKQQKIVTYFIVVGLLVALLFSFFIFRGLKAQRKANEVISKQKEEVHRQKEIVEKQKHLVEEHQKEILDSIRYAKRIQDVLLAHQSFINDNLPNNFVLFKPKDIVSGDFYWAAKHGDNFYLACCDSTGHGVPGAFMSLLNIGFLSEAINEKEITEPNKILDYVRQRLIVSISKEGQKDGFDGILICVNQQTKQITYSAAHNAPILINNSVMHELEKDKMPVGIGERTENFTLHTINLQKGDTLYLYTDGYADQFGGEKGKKFKYKQLNELLLAVSDKPLAQQASVLEEAFDDWKGSLEQVDDVCVIGIQV